MPPSTLTMNPTPDGPPLVVSKQNANLMDDFRKKSMSNCSVSQVRWSASRPSANVHGLLPMNSVPESVPTLRLHSGGSLRKSGSLTSTPMTMLTRSVLLSASTAKNPSGFGFASAVSSPANRPPLSSSPSTTRMKAFSSQILPSAGSDAPQPMPNVQALSSGRQPETRRSPGTNRGLVWRCQL